MYKMKLFIEGEVVLSSIIVAKTPATYTKVIGSVFGANDLQFRWRNNSTSLRKGANLKNCRLSYADHFSTVVFAVGKSELRFECFVHWKNCFF